ncbi:MAG: hypothetical protein J2P57_20625 [Acidimicrobiaceae bacterium]|nr:hypothetical protein [Acidimicrobiaceae bacterium]
MTWVSGGCVALTAASSMRACSPNESGAMAWLNRLWTLWPSVIVVGTDGKCGRGVLVPGMAELLAGTVATALGWAMSVAANVATPAAPTSRRRAFD